MHVFSCSKQLIQRHYLQRGQAIFAPAQIFLREFSRVNREFESLSSDGLSADQTAGGAPPLGLGRGDCGFPFSKTHSSCRRQRHFGSPPSCWRRRRAESCHQPRDLLEHLQRYHDLGHLKRDVAWWSHHLGADLEQLFP
jgi:hypothetical protein